MQAKNNQIRVLYLSTLVLLLPIFSGIYFLFIEDGKKEEVYLQPEQIEKISVSLDKIQTTAHAAIVVDLNSSNVLYQKNADKSLPLASLTKLVTAQVAQTQIDAPTVSIDKMQEFAEYGDQTLSQNQNWDKEELIQYTLMTSSNDGAHSLATNSKNAPAFVENMNNLVATIGLLNTRFYNETGLDNDVSGIIASKGTAQDVSKILSYLIKHDLSLYEKTQHATSAFLSSAGTQIATNTNETVDQIPGILVSKTGYTDLAGGNLAVVADMGLNEPVAFVVLKSSKEARFEDVLKLQEEYFAQLRERMR
jgi:D-alanyl-D-alanine carboxypeptidase (penicillin-binding protein 5/6)